MKPDVRLSRTVIPAVTGDIDPETVVAVRKLGETLIAQDSGEPLTVDLSGLPPPTVVLSMLLCWARHAWPQNSRCHLVFRVPATACCRWPR